MSVYIYEHVIMDEGNKVNTRLKQRLLGAAVLGAIIVLIVPFFMSRKPQYSDTMSLSQQIPSPPQPLTKSKAQALQQSIMADDFLVDNKAVKDDNVGKSTSDQTATVEEQQVIIKKVTVQPEGNQPITNQVGQIHRSNQGSSTTKKHQIVASDHSNKIVHRKKETQLQQSALLEAENRVDRELEAHIAAPPHMASHQTSSTKKSGHDKHHTKTTAAYQGAWTIQLASFAESKHADHLMKTLKNKGYHAYTRQRVTSVGIMTRVMVGPELSHEEAEHVMSKLKRDTHLKGFILKYKPLEV